MTTKTLIKRTLAFMLCMVMLVSCWVFTAPSAVAEDAEAGSYTVKVTIDVEDAYDNYWTDGKDNGEPKAFINGYLFWDFYYLENNGSGTTEQVYTYSFSDWAGGQNYNNTTDPSYSRFNACFASGQEGEHTVTVTLPGFPSGFYTEVHNGTWTNWGTKYENFGYTVKSFEVYNNATSAFVSLWEGDLRVWTDKETRLGTIRYDGTAYAQAQENESNTYKEYSCSTADAFKKNDTTVDRTQVQNVYNNSYNYYTRYSNTFEGWSDKFPAPQHSDYHYTKEYSAGAPESSYTYVAPEQATLTSAYTFSSVDQYGVQLGGTLTTGFAVTGHKYYDGSAYIATNDNTTYSFNAQTGTITPLKASNMQYQYYQVKPYYHWTIGGANANTNGVTDGMYYGAERQPYFNYAPATVTYQYNATNSLATAADADSDGIFDTVAAANTVAVGDAGSNADYTKFYGDSVTGVPAAGQYTDHYFDATGHYSGGSFTAYGAITANDTKDMVYSTTTAHNFPNTWTEMTEDMDGISAADYHYRVCNAVEGEEHNQYQAHSWSQWSVTTSPNCTDTGEETRTCVCGAEQTREVSSLGHSYTSVVTAPTCAEAGYTTYTCSVCGNSYTANIVPATGNHTEVTDAAVAPTCVATGLTAGSHCSVCNTVLVAQSTAAVADATQGHDWALEEKKATDGTDGHVYYRCSNGCGKFCAAQVDNTSETHYAPNYDDAEDLKPNAAATEDDSVRIPAPTFNDSATDTIYNVVYASRLASLRIEPEEATQAMRFAGSVAVPSGISTAIGSESVTDNVVVDFGFVYTQTRFITLKDGTIRPDYLDFNGNAATGKPTAEKGNIGYQIYQMSVKRNNSGLAYNGSNGWAGVTQRTIGGVTYLTFNLVIEVTASNWGREYSARPYITYKFNGTDYTVYDNGRVATDEDSTYYYNSVNDIAESIMYENEDMEYYVGIETPYQNYVNRLLVLERDKNYCLEKIFAARVAAADVNLNNVSQVDNFCWNNYWCTPNQIKAFRNYVTESIYLSGNPGSFVYPE